MIFHRLNCHGIHKHLPGSCTLLLELMAWPFDHRVQFEECIDDSRLWMRMRASSTQGFRHPITVLFIYCHHPTASNPMVKSTIKGMDSVPSRLFDILDQQPNGRISRRPQVKTWQTELRIPCHQEGISL